MGDRPKASSRESSLPLFLWRLPLFFLLTLVALGTVLVFQNPVGPLEGKGQDALFRLRYFLDSRLHLDLVPPLAEEIVIVAIDDGDLIRHPQLAEEYEMVAMALRDCAELGADRVVLDAVFLRGTETEAGPLLSAIEALEADFREVIFAEIPLEDRSGDRGYRVVRSFPFREDAPLPAGDIRLTRDPDGIVRSYQYIRGAGKDWFPSLAVAALISRDAAPASRPDPDSGLLQWQSSETGRANRTVDGLPSPLNFREPWNIDDSQRLLDAKLERPFRRFWNLRDLWERAADGTGERPFMGKTVFLGYSAGIVRDFSDTVLADDQPSVLVHVQAYSDLLQGARLRKASRLESACFVVLALLLCLGGSFQSRSKIRHIGVALSIVAILSVAFTLFAWGRVLVDPVFLFAVYAAGELLGWIRRLGLERHGHRILLNNLQDPTSGGEPLKYQAFLSYSSRNRKQVTQLYRDLTRYQIPVAMVGRETGAGAVPGGITQIFFDRSSARSSPDVAGELHRSLDRSAFLIVACSPDAAASKWVGKEIEKFRQRGLEHRIHAIILDIDDPELESRSCFHPAIGKNLPLAADQRPWPKGDGRHKARLKLIAGILDLNLEELQALDDENRAVGDRLRSIAWSVGLVAIAALSLLGASLWKSGNETHRELQSLREQLRDISSVPASGDPALPPENPPVR